MDQRQHECGCRLLKSRFRLYRHFTHKNFTPSLPLSDAPGIRDCSPSQRDQLLADLRAAETSRCDAVVPGTHKKQNLAWSRWVLFCDGIGLGEDHFLDNIARPYRIHLILAFAHAVHNGRYSKAGVVTPLQSGTVKDSISALSAAFRFNNRPNPTVDLDGKPFLLLQRQWRAYANSDRQRKPQKAINIAVLRRLIEVATSSLDKAVADLIVGAFFFAMRSCEYCTVQSSEHRTRRLCLRNIRFFRRQIALSHTDDLSRADSVAITFEFQKNDVKWDTVPMSSSNDDTLCPVKAWAAIVQRLWLIPGTTPDTPVNTVFIAGAQFEITSDLILGALRAVVDDLGQGILGYSKEEIGTHSLRSGCAMAMHLAGIPVYMMMLIGRWSSEAFMVYIQRQVKEFATNVSAKMIQQKPFYIIPAYATIFSGANSNTSH